MAAHETRYITTDDGGDLRVESRAADGRPQIVGVAPPWNRWSVDLGGFVERFKPGAFSKWLQRAPSDPRGRADVVAKWNHDDSAILGRTLNGTLELEETEGGLLYRATPPEGTPTTAEVLPLIAQRYVVGSSFAFSLPSAAGEIWDEEPNGRITRTITEAALHDVSPVAHAAYPASSVGLRSLTAWRQARGLVRAEPAGLTVSIDYDGTFTAAPGLWRSFAEDAIARGVRVVCITRREDTEENRAALAEAFAGIELAATVLAGPESSKRAAAEAAGLAVDVWIDDRPATVDGPAPQERSVRVSTDLGLRAAAAASIARMRASHAGKL